MTGDVEDNSRNLSLMKFGMALMSGRTTSGGFSGFLDVVGQAGQPLADDLMAIQQQEKAEARELASEFRQYDNEMTRQMNEQERAVMGMRIQSIQNLENQEIRQRSDFINSQLKYMKDKADLELAMTKMHAEANGIKDKLITVTVPDSNSMGGQRNITLGVSATTGRRMLRKKVMGAAGQMVFRYVEPQNEELTMLEGGNEVLKPDPTARRRALASMSAANVGFKYIKTFEQIINEGDVKPGVSGYLTNVAINVRSFTSDAFGLLGQTIEGGNAAGMNVDYSNDDFANAYQKVIEANGATEKDKRELAKRFNKDFGETQKIVESLSVEGQKSKFFDTYVKRMGGLQDADKGKEDKIARDIANLLLIEQRMKYILANANKGQDRLTVADVDDAARVTQIFALTKGSDIIEQSYQVLKGQLRTAFDDALTQYRAAGGGENAIYTFKDTPQYKEWLDKQQAQGGVEPQTTQQDIDAIRADVTRFFGNPGGE